MKKVFQRISLPVSLAALVLGLVAVGCKGDSPDDIDPTGKAAVDAREGMPVPPGAQEPASRTPPGRGSGEAGHGAAPGGGGEGEGH